MASRLQHLAELARRKASGLRAEANGAAATAVPDSALYGFVDQITPTKASGWVYDPAERSREVPVRLVLDGRTIAEGVANLLRASVGQLLGTEGRHGFALADLQLAPADVGQAVIEARAADGRWQPVRRPSGGGKRAVQYQSFDDAKGASKSGEKLKALQLRRLPNRHSDATPLKGLSVLDLGCNEGFFCGEALRQGASRVVGIDFSNQAIERARKRFPDATFTRGTWWNLPNEQFDVILFLSAIHYEPRQRALLQKLANHLTPTGTLVLECGIVGTAVKTWHTVKRADGVRRYPSYLMLRHELLKPYAVRHVGESVRQAGDPVARFVYHCRLKSPVALLLVGPSNVGKSSLAFDLGERNIPLLHTDRLLGSIMNDKRYDWSPVARVVRSIPRRSPVNFGEIGRAVAAECAADFVDILVREGPLEADIFCIEGEILRHDAIRNELLRRLREQDIRPWLLTPDDSTAAAEPAGAAPVATAPAKGRRWPWQKAETPPSAAAPAGLRPLKQDTLRHLEALEADTGVASQAAALSRLRTLGIEQFAAVLWAQPDPRFPRLGTLLPAMASAEVQRTWTGNAGQPILDQSLGFVGAVAAKFADITGQSLTGKRILDFGCGYGRFTRVGLFHSDATFGVDPSPDSVRFCQEAGLGDRVFLSEYLPESLPVPDDFDLILAFSVFTHLSERATRTTLQALRKHVSADGLACITIRPVGYWRRVHKTRGEAWLAAREEAHRKLGFVFEPHPRKPIDGDITYGDTSMSIDWLAPVCAAAGWTIVANELTPADPVQQYVFLRPA